MLLKDDKKGLVTIIMKRMKGMSPDMSPSFDKSEKSIKAPTKDGAETDYDIAMESSAKSMMEALKSNDPKSFSKSLKSFIELCCDYDDKEM